MSAWNWAREIASLLRQYGHASREYRTSMRKLQEANPSIPAEVLREAVKEKAWERPN